jgi:SAM-dependent methyltransferase
MNGWLAAFAIRERILRKRQQRTEYNAKDYVLNSSPQLQRGKKLIAEIEQKENLRVLDVGCGDGRTTLELCRHLPNIEKLVGVDFSASQINAAQKLFSHNPYIDNSRVRFVQGSFLDKTPKQLGHFDLVFSNLAIHWIGAEAYDKIHELLTPTGKLIAEQCAKDDLAGLANVRLTAISELGLGHFFDDTEKLGHLYAPTKDELQAKLERVGFANIAIEQEEIEYTVSDGIYEAYAASSLHSFYDALGDAELCIKLRKKFLEICHRDRVPAIAKRLIMTAEKTHLH